MLGITDTKRINQAANFAPTDWDTNQRISDRAPAEYWPELVAERATDPTWLERQMYWHGLPEGWHTLAYDDFLRERRRRIVQVTRDGFEQIARGGSAPTTITLSPTIESIPQEPTLSSLFSEGYLRPGDQLDPLELDRSVDAVITGDGTIQIDGTHEFDSLDDAARYLEVTNVSGFEFWALESDGELTPLSELLDAAPRLH